MRVAHVLGDRRDHFESNKDVWEMFQIILEERKRREIDPTLHVLQECVAALGKQGASDASTRERLLAMLEFLTTIASLYEEVRRMPPVAIRGLARWRGKMRKVMGK